MILYTIKRYMKNIIIIILAFVIIVGCKSQEKNIVAAKKQDQMSWHSDTKPMISAHRGGGDYKGYPENCIESFEYFYNKTSAIVECDIRMTKDGVMVLMHDESLDRTTTGTGKVSSKNWSEIKDLFLKDNFGNKTSYHIPTFEDAIQLGLDLNMYYTWDIKRGTPFANVLTQIHKMDARAISIIIVYSMEDALLVHKIDPEIRISMAIRNMKEYDMATQSGIPWDKIIAFTGTVESEPALYEKLHDKGVRCILGTLGNLDKKAAAKGDHTYLGYIERGADILATDRPLEVKKVLGN